MSTARAGSDRDAVSNVVLTERAGRDLAQWEQMRQTFLDDSRVRVSWFQGSGPDFVSQSQTMHEAGAQSFHEIGALHVEVSGDRALVHANAAVHVRGEIGGVALDITTYGRLYWRLRQVGERWFIATLEMVYLKDVVTPVDPARGIAPDLAAAAAAYRPSYRYLSALLHASGREIDQELPGTDRPDLVEALLADHDTWLR